MYKRYAVSIQNVDADKEFRTKQAAMEYAQSTTIDRKTGTNVYRCEHFPDGTCNIYHLIHYWWDGQFQYILNKRIS